MIEDIRLTVNLGKFRVNFEYDTDKKAFTRFFCSVINGYEIRTASLNVSSGLSLNELLHLFKEIENNVFIKERLKHLEDHDIVPCKRIIDSIIKGYLIKRGKRDESSRRS